MGGVATSKRCALCKARKIKIHNFSQCRRSNRACPGYTRHLQFHDATQVVWQRYAPQVREALNQGDRTSDLQLSKLMPQSSSDLLMSKLISAMDQSLPAGFRLDSSAGFFTFIPRRLGRVSALDEAIDCMLALHSEYLAGEPSWRWSSQMKYVRAIRSLQTYVDNAATRTTSEVICAVLVLGYVEYFSGFSPGGFGSHVEGAAQLIQIRGHQTFSDEFDKATLHSNASDLLYESLWKSKRDQSVFNGWTEYERGDYSNVDHSIRRWRVFSEHVLTVGQLIEVFRGLPRYPGQPNAPLADLVIHLSQRRNILLEWYEDWNASSRIANTWLEPSPADSSSPFSTIRRFSGNLVATSTHMYWWLLIFLNRMILALQPSCLLSEENARIAADLCKSHEYAMQQKPFGSFFNMASISLRVAYPEIRVEGTKIWLKNALKEINSELRLGDPEKNGVNDPVERSPWGIRYSRGRNTLMYPLSLSMKSNISTMHS